MADTAGSYEWCIQLSYFNVGRVWVVQYIGQCSCITPTCKQILIQENFRKYTWSFSPDEYSVSGHPGPNPREVQKFVENVSDGLEPGFAVLGTRIGFSLVVQPDKRD